MNTINHLTSQPRIPTITDIMLQAISEGADPERAESEDIDRIREVADRYAQIVYIHDFARIRPYCINEFGRNYFGFDCSNLQHMPVQVLWDKILDEDYGRIHDGIAFFKTQPAGTRKVCFRLKNTEGAPSWKYSVSSNISHAVNAPLRFLMEILYDIEGLVELADQLKHGTAHRDYTGKKQRYNGLTERERQVLKMISQEQTSEQIASTLCIGASTVDTHRRNIVRKLKTRSSIGLVEYDLLFSRG